MKVYWKMPLTLQPYFNDELIGYRDELQKENLSAAWRHLERAHIIGQNWFVEHSYIHWLMLCFGFKVKSSKEVFGQIPRLIFGGVKSFVGKVPIGNPGGSNVPPLKPFEIPEDLKLILAKA